MNNKFTFRLEYQIPELWGQIASSCTPATLRNLSLVNRRMVDPVQRYLFEALAFRVRQKDVFSNTGELLEDSEERYNSLISRTAERLETLSTSHFSQYVRRWLCEGAIGFPDYHSNPSHHIGLHHTHAIQAFMTSLPRYSLLNSLCLSRMEVTSCVLGTLPALRNLKTLQFHLVLFKCQLALPNPLPLEEFLVELWQQEDYDEPDGIDTAHGTFFSPEQLETMTMKYTPNGKSTLFFCNTLINYKPSNNLVELRFTIYDCEEGIELLMKVLKASPLLRTLHIILDSETDDGLIQLEEAMMALDLELNTVCPLLDDLACSATFASVFAQGRPIQKFCMEVGDYYTSCPLPDVMRSLLAFKKEILTDLNFEQTRTDNARELIPFLNGLFPNLQVLRMPMNDLADDTDTDDEQFDGIEPVDDRQINDPDDIERERRQFESCYDDNDIKMQPEALLHFGEGYLRLLSDIAFGAIELPESLVKLDLPQTRLFKRLKFTKDHEIQLIKLFAMNRKLKDLQWLRLGIDNVHNKHWTKDSDGQWKKERYYFRAGGKELVGTICLFPTRVSPDSDQVFSQTLTNVSGVVT